MLLQFYRDLLARIVTGTEDSINAGAFSLSDAIDLAERIETIGEAIEVLEEYYGIDDDNDDDESMSQIGG